MSGTNAFGTHIAVKADGGGFGGVFNVRFVSPAILAFFTDSGNLINLNSGIAFTPRRNTWVTVGNTSHA